MSEQQVQRCSAGNAIRIRILIRSDSLKPLFGTPLLIGVCMLAWLIV